VAWEKAKNGHDGEGARPGEGRRKLGKSVTELRLERNIAGEHFTAKREYECGKHYGAWGEEGPRGSREKVKPTPI